mgnify:CR=1 FL=1|jgi:hypothetical protein
MKSLMLISIAVALISAGCSSSVTLPNDPSNPMERMAYNQNLKDNRPDWTNKGLWEEGDYLYQVGQSMVFDTEREAKKHAYRDASFRITEYVRQNIDMNYSEMNVAQTTSTDVISQSYATKEKNSTRSQVSIGKIAAQETYVEPVFDRNENLGYAAFAMVRVPKKSIKVASQPPKVVQEKPLAQIDQL